MSSCEDIGKFVVKFQTIIDCGANSLWILMRFGMQVCSMHAGVIRKFGRKRTRIAVMSAIGVRAGTPAVYPATVAVGETVPARRDLSWSKSYVFTKVTYVSDHLTGKNKWEGFLPFWVMSWWAWVQIPPVCDFRFLM